MALDAIGSLLVTTICRGSTPGTPSGFLVTIDWQHHRVDSRCPVPPAPLLSYEPNPRGGVRGGRGLASFAGTVFVANGSQIMQFDRTWQRLATISHPLCGNLHDLAVHDGGLWACSTANDALVRFDLSGHLSELIDLRTVIGEPSDRDRFDATLDYRDPRAYVPQKTDRLHLNSVTFGDAGQPLVTLGMAGSGGGVLVPVDSGDALTISHGGAVPIHDVLDLDGNRILSLDTPNGSVLSISRSGEVRRGPAIAPPAPDGFLRGMCLVGDRLVVGDRNRLLIVDCDSLDRVGTIVVAPATTEAVYAIERLPEGFGALPHDLPA